MAFVPSNIVTGLIRCTGNVSKLVEIKLNIWHVTLTIVEMEIIVNIEN